MRAHPRASLKWRTCAVWARQKAIRERNGSDYSKVYDGVKYDRKINGSLMGKLVSHGTLINIDGDDYVEYRI